MTVTDWTKRVLTFSASTELAITLFLTIAVVAVPGTVTESRALYSSPLFLLLLALFGGNLLLCTWKRFRSISRPVLVLHSGVLIVLAGCVLASSGYVATVNLYEGSTVDQVYRWDRKRDTPLGAQLTLKRINWEYYPMPVKIGVLRGGQKEQLFELKTGQSFTFRGYRVEVGPVMFNTENLKLSVFRDNRFVGFFDTLTGRSDLPPDFPFTFMLVAYKTPQLKSQWVDVALKDANGVVYEGTSRVNGPLQWRGLYFFNTQVERDAAGVPYAGIQIVHDPGRWLVFTGMAVVVAGACMAAFRRWYGFR